MPPIHLLVLAQVLYPGPTLNTPRAGAPAELMPNGTAVICGGFVANDGGSYATDCELLDMRLGLWTVDSLPLPVDQVHFASVRLSDGTVMLTDNITPPVQLFALDGGHQAGPPDIGVDTDALLLSSRGDVFAAGGRIAGSTVTARVQRYLADGGGWTQQGPLSAARHDSTLSEVHGVLVVVAGDDDVNNGADIDVLSLDGAPLGVAMLSDARSSAITVVLADGRLLVAAGSNTTQSSELLTVDGGAVVVAPGPALPELYGLGATAARLPDGRVVIAGGTSSFARDIATWNPASSGSDFASTGLTLSTDRSDAVSLLLPSGAQLIIGGSPLGGDASATSDVIDLLPYTEGVLVPFGVTLKQARTVMLPSLETLVVGSDGSVLAWWVLDRALAVVANGTLATLMTSLDGLVVLPDGRPFVLFDGKGAVFDRATQTWSAVTGPPLQVTTPHLTRSADGNPVLVGVSAGDLQVMTYSPATDTWTKAIDTTDGGPVDSVARAADGTLWVLERATRVTQYNVESGSIVSDVPTPNPFAGIALERADGRLMLGYTLGGAWCATLDYRDMGCVADSARGKSIASVTLPSDDVVMFDESVAQARVYSWPLSTVRHVTLSAPVLAAQALGDEGLVIVTATGVRMLARRPAPLDTLRPSLNSAVITGRTRVDLSGALLRGVGSGTSDGYLSAPTDFPYITALTAEGDVVPLRLLHYSPTQAQIEFLGPAPRGPLFLGVVVSGVSSSAPLEISIGRRTGESCTIDDDCAAQHCRCGACQLPEAPTCADAGTSLDAGVATDGGVVTDGGVAEPRLLSAACGCSTGGSSAILLLAFVLCRRRPLA